MNVFLFCVMLFLPKRVISSHSSCGQLQRHSYKIPSKFISSIKKQWTRSKSKRIRRVLGLSPFEIAGLNARKSQLETAIEEYKKEADIPYFFRYHIYNSFANDSVVVIV